MFGNDLQQLKIIVTTVMHVVYVALNYITSMSHPISWKNHLFPDF